MKKIIAYCGNRCDLCPAYVKNIVSDEMKSEISEKWLKYFGFRFNPEEIECVGCHKKGKHADPACPVRPCAREKGLKTCGNCSEFMCKTLKERMDFIQKNVKDLDTIPKKDFERYIRPYLGRKRLEKKSD